MTSFFQSPIVLTQPRRCPASSVIAFTKAYKDNILYTHGIPRARGLLFSLCYFPFEVHVSYPSFFFFFCK